MVFITYFCTRSFTKKEIQEDGQIIEDYISSRLSLVAQAVKNPTCNAGNVGSIPESGRSPGEGNCNPLQYSYPGNPLDKGAWWATVHGVAKRIGCNLLTKQQNCYLRLTERKTFWATRWWRQVMGR